MRAKLDKEILTFSGGLKDVTVSPSKEFERRRGIGMDNANKNSYGAIFYLQQKSVRGRIFRDNAR